MRSTLAAILILALAACGDDGPSRLDLDEVRIAKVSGDQAAVAGTSQATPLHSVSASPRLAVTAGEDWTPEPLVGRIETVGARTNGISGPSMLPPDMLAHWHLPEEAGRLLAASTPPDDSLHILNRWAPSTRAGEYTAVARRILADGSVHEDARWTLVVEPGAAASVAAPERIRLVEGAVRTITASVEDSHGNAVEYTISADESVVAVDGRAVEAVAPGVGAYSVMVDDTVAGGGELFVYPDFVSPALWSAELVCETPDGVMVDRFEFVVDDIERGDSPRMGATLRDPGVHAAAAGLDSASATVAYTTGLRRLVIEAGDTIYDTADGVRLDGHPMGEGQYGAEHYTHVINVHDFAVVPADALVYPRAEYPYSLESLRVGEWHPIEGLPLLLTRDGEALAWSGEATAACASDGWPDATAGTWTIRVED